MKLIQKFLFIGVVGLFLASCNNPHPGFEKTDSGIFYQVVNNSGGDSDVKIDSGMFWNMGMSYGAPDSLMYDFKMNPTYFDMPFAKPQYPGDINEALALLSIGDSAVIIIRADSFFLKTVKAKEVPELFKESNDLYFYIKLVDILTIEQIQAANEIKLEERKAKELSELTVYLSGNYPDLDPNESGVFIVKDKKGNGKMPKDGDMLDFDFRVTILNGAELHDSEKAGRPGVIEKGKPFDTDGFTEGLNSMRVGDEITLIVPSKMAYKAQGRQGLIEPYTTLIYWIRLNSTQSKAQFEKEQAIEKAKAEKERAAQQAKADAEAAEMKGKEAATIANYIKENNVTVEPTASGLYYIETGIGTGEQPVAGDRVKVHYMGTLLDGTKFDASYDRGQPFEFTLGKGQVIKGWDEGIAMMKVGGKATLIVPSEIAYGAGARGDVIHAYAPLKFDVELLEVTKAE